MPLCSSCFGYYVREPCPTCFNKSNSYSNHNVEEKLKEVNSELNIKVPIFNSHTKQELADFLSIDNSNVSVKNQNSPISLSSDTMFSLFKENLDKSIQKAKNLSLNLKKKDETILELRKNNIMLKKKIIKISDTFVKKNEEILKLEKNNQLLEIENADLKLLNSNFSKKIDILEDDKSTLKKRLNTEKKSHKIDHKEILSQIKILSSIKLKETETSRLNGNLIRNTITSIENLINETNKDPKIEENASISPSSSNLQKYKKINCQKCGFRLSPRNIENKMQLCSSCSAKQLK